MENKLITFKKLENGRYFFDLHKYLINFIISFILIFPLIYFPTKNSIFAFLCVIIFGIIISIFIEISDYVGKKFHHKIFEKKIFKDLRLRNFEKEKIGKYEGLIKTENGRTIRIFYNWNKTAEGPLSFGDIEINIFYEPQFIENDFNRVNINKLKALNKKYDKSFWSKTKRIMFTLDCLKVCFNYYPWTKSDKIEREIIIGLKILNDTDLSPFDLRNIKNKDLRQKELEGCFYPDMQFIWEYLEKNCR
ncbi:hypothetical protein G6R40_02130 [Chryseobacterium sp. POL2]|uniref:hypothetical protein n=1 Tax=Chryseobacterium sp. POL2 TaxID=2713414 RepID=UPI0013E101DB|nr:hypothetical protein [Chryseobacterium sp. POL2]QIG88530.1 hypothetical protein G6R40_02130 [Chryseobacterium sp. POL2]